MPLIGKRVQTGAPSRFFIVHNDRYDVSAIAGHMYYVIIRLWYNAHDDLCHTSDTAFTSKNQARLYDHATVERERVPTMVV